MSTETWIEARGLYDSFPRKGGSAPTATHYCAGCGHGILHKLIAEALADLGIQDRAVMISPVGCAVFAYYYFDCGNIQVAHGRAPAVATGVKRSDPRTIVISYQGDGDLCSIGFNQTFQAANRGEGVAVFFVNNAVYGMTGGQMAPTTLLGQKTSTSPNGRDALNDGYPIHACEVLNTLEAPVYIERCSLADSARISKARQAVRKALQIQVEGKGYAFVEFLSPCPTNMKNGPLGAAAFVAEALEEEFPLGRLRDKSADAVARPEVQRHFDKASLDAAFGVQDYEQAAAVPDPTFALRRIKIAGFGGQGVLSLGLMLARAGQLNGRMVTWFPSYGPEQRGGTANCSVLLSGSEIGSPVVSSADLLVALNQPSLVRFADDVVPGGTIFYDTAAGEFTPPAGVEALAVPALDIAASQGVARAANTAMLGVLCARGVTGLPTEVFRKVVEASFAAKPKICEANLRVLDAAMLWAETRV